MKNLRKKAEDFVLKKLVFPPAVPCQSFYRDKRVGHFTNNQMGIIEVYLKDTNGDPANPINEMLSGIFFSASMDRKTGYPPVTSIYGSERISVLPRVLLDHNLANLYFSDFYCFNRSASHYVLLVITWKHTEADRICENKLEKINKYNNPFLWINPHGYVMVTSKVWVEVFFTNNIRMIDLLNEGMACISRCIYDKKSSRGPKSKNTDCKECNIAQSH